MKALRTITTKLFIPLAFFLRPSWVQRALRKIGMRLPYFLAKKLNYSGVVDFKIGNQRLLMQSYNTPIEMTIFWKGVFSGREGSELFVWNKLCKLSSIALDIGANSGIYSVIAANSVDQVHAFEPVPVVNTILKENIALNKFTNVHTRTEVVSDVDGFATLYVPKQGWVDVASIDKKFANRYATDDQMQKIECDSVTIDTFLSTLPYDKKIVIAKVDVEGAETKVIQGMKKTLSIGKIAVLAELLNENAFDEVVKLLPEQYCVYGIVDYKPYTQITKEYVVGIKNYLLLPKDLIKQFEIK